MTANGAMDEDLPSMIAAGWQQISRYQELPEADRLDALVRATELFADVYPAAPEAVPGPLRDACAAISATRDGVPTDHIEQHDEAIDLLEEAERNHDQAAADQAIWKLAVVTLAARGHPLLSGYLSHLGTAWADRFRLTGRIADLDNAIGAHRKAIPLPPPDPADRAGFRANYSAALRARYEATGETSYLGQAVTLAREAVELGLDTRARHAGHAARFALSTGLQNLAAALQSRFQLRRDRADLNAAIDAAREAVPVTDRSDRGYSIVQSLLANALLDRFSRYWDVADLNDAMAAAQAGLAAAPPAGRVRAVALSTLAAAHANLFKHSGDIRDLDRATATGRESVSAAHGDPIGAAICLSNLGGILTARFNRVGDVGALDEAIGAHRQAVRNAPAGYVNRAAFLSSLGNTLRSRFQAGGAPARIDEAIEVLREAVATAPAGWLDRPGYVANLAESLIAAAERQAGPAAPTLGEPAALAQAATLGQAAAILRTELEAIPAAHPLRHLCLASAGHAWLTLSDLTSDTDALDNAIAHWRQASDGVSAGHPQRAEYLTILGAAWQRKFDRSRQAGQPDRAAGAASVEASKSAACITTASPLTRALAARNWGEVAAGLVDIREAASGFAAAVDLMDRVAWRGLRRSDQERQLGRFTGLAGAAAAWAIAAGQAERAVELLEQGRGVLLAQALADRARRHDLFRDAPDLARELEAADDLLESLPSAADLVPATAEAAAAQREGLSRRREEILAQIRALRGYSGFLRAPSFGDLRTAARPGPVVIVNVSQYRCDALIVTADGVRATPLTGLTGADVVHHTAAFLGALDSMHQQMSIGGLKSAHDAITATLRWLWETIGAPLLPGLLAASALKLPGAPEPTESRPRVWWCPTGPLTFLPLHAAGVHDGGGNSVLDHVVSSYALTLRSLQRARERPRRDAGSTPIVVALPETPGQRPLPNAGLEADVVAARFPHARQFRGSQAMTDTVTGALEGSPPLAHFACHGTQDVTDPSSGHLALYDGPLHIAPVARMRLEAAELAFLSACETSRGGIELVDEAITVAAAFQLAGYRHVVGTLWAIDDELAPAVADHVYRALTRGGDTDLNVGGTAAALDAAIRVNRNKPPWLWAPYIHFGP
jgi:CHAT domain-containing protein